MEKTGLQRNKRKCDMMIIIGLTGGIGSGKSTVSSYMKTLGIPVFDADASSRAAVKKGSACLEEIVQFFGPDCLLSDGELNRSWVAAKVFHDKKMLKQYEKIVQDQVLAEAQQFLADQKEKNAAVAVLDVPLLIECGWHTKVDSVWLVKVSEEIQIRRAMLRDGATEEAVTARINAQMSLTDKEKYADVIIDNSGSVESTKVQVTAHMHKLLGAV